MTIGIWILGSQLNTDHPLWRMRDDQLQGRSPSQLSEPSLNPIHPETPILFIEALELAQARPYHRQKLIFIWSAMRHFAQELRDRGWQNVTYAVTDHVQPALQTWLEQQQVTEVWMIEPPDFPMRRQVTAWLDTCNQAVRAVRANQANRAGRPTVQARSPVMLKWHEDHQFFWSATEFMTWATGRKRLVLEDFYRAGRKRFGILMTGARGDQPIGDRWNFDADNRKPPKGISLNPPPPLRFALDEITQAVIEKVQKIPDLYGQAEPFIWAVTRSQALQVLDFFIQQGLPQFGPYQDAMLTHEPTLWHSLLSPYLNVGLLSPQETIAAVVRAYQTRDLPLASVEGFIRQVLGWREYMRGLYLFLGEDYAQSNWFDHRRSLPTWFWDSRQTRLNCLRQTLQQLEATGYTHHIQRLMVLSNFALIAGLSPQAVEQWFHATFIDAYDWVMQTNVLGMGLFADGGTLASKPYAASANYIHKMSDYCDRCSYDRKDRLGENACPFNYLYWDFLDRHQDKLKSQGRMNLALAQLKKIPEHEIQKIRENAQKFQASLSDVSTN